MNRGCSAAAGRLESLPGVAAAGEPLHFPGIARGPRLERLRLALARVRGLIPAGLVPALFAASSVFLALPSAFYGRFNNGIDAHYKIALWWAVLQRWVFGKDIVFTYGPLAFLEGRPEFRGTALPLLLWDVLFYASFGYVLFRVHSELSSARQRVAALACVAAMGLSSGINGAVLLFPLELYCLFRYEVLRRPGWFGAAALAALIGFYVKVSTGAVGLLLLTPFLVRAALRREQRREAQIAAGGVLLALLFSAALLRVDLLGYLRGSAAFISGYDEAQALPIPPESRYVLSLALLPIVAFAWGLLRHARVLLADRQQLLFALLSAAMYFLYFKQGFVRFDWWHYLQFFQFGPLPLGIFYCFANAQTRRAVDLAFLLAVFAALSFFLQSLDGSALLERARAVRGYLHTAFAQRAVPPVPPGLANAPGLPESFVARIGSSTVDILPHDAARGLRSELDYRPRPTVQSFCALTPYLDQLDATFFDSTRAPEFVVYSHIALPWPAYTAAWTAPRTRLALLRNYDSAGVAEDQLLLQRRSVARTITPGRHWSGKARLSEPLDVPVSDGIVLLRAQVKQSIAARLLSKLYKPYELDLELGLSGKSAAAVILRAHLSDGVPVSPWVGDLEGAGTLFAGDLRGLPRPEQATLDAPEPDAYKRSYEYEFVELLVSGAAPAP